MQVGVRHLQASKPSKASLIEQLWLRFSSGHIVMHGSRLLYLADTLTLCWPAHQLVQAPECRLSNARHIHGAGHLERLKHL